MSDREMTYPSYTDRNPPIRRCGWCVNHPKREQGQPRQIIKNVSHNLVWWRDDWWTLCGELIASEVAEEPQP